MLLGIGSVARLPWAIAWLGATEPGSLQAALAHATPSLDRVIGFAVAGMGLLAFVGLRLMDAQWIFSLARTAFFLAAFHLVCAIFSGLPMQSYRGHRFCAAAVLLFGTVHFFAFGLIRYYWRRRSYGDAAMEMLTLCAFVGFAWPSVWMLFSERS